MTVSHTLWRWQPIQSEREKYPEAIAQQHPLPHHFQIVAARVRGKKHKHEGNNCDDWFEVTRSGEWTIIAVADGAGSQLFSRIGAKVACQSATSYLARKLRHHTLQTRDHWNAETFARLPKTYQFQQPDLEFTQQLLHEALLKAYHAIEKACHHRDELKYYYKAVGERDLTLQDFASTLLLVLHTTVTIRETIYSFVLTCQIGDGLSAVIYKNTPQTGLLSEIEKNNFSGETQFITSSRPQLARELLAIKTFPFFGPLQALLVMTDGVSDDYFPPEKGMLRLLGDLMLNGVLPIPIREYLLSPPQELELEHYKAEYLTLEYRISEQGPQPTWVASVTDYARILGCEIEQLISHPNLLKIPEEIGVQAESPASRLLTWLDSYQVRGSFDDRTLVVLHPV